MTKFYKTLANKLNTSDKVDTYDGRLRSGDISNYEIWVVNFRYFMSNTFGGSEGKAIEVQPRIMV